MLGLTLTGNLLADIVVFLVPMILSLSVHEYAHAMVAWRLGDDTAARNGRLTLNPMSHIDVFGTLLVPAVGVYLAGFAMIGWAKPVPVRPERFHRRVTMRTGMIVTALAGPLSNLLLAVLSIGVAALLLRFAPHMFEGAKPGGVVMLLKAMFILNIGLFVFNLLPLPPLDGSRLLPRSMDGFVATVSPYSFILLIVMLNIPLLREWLLVRPIFLTVSVLQTVFQTPLWGVM